MPSSNGVYSLPPGYLAVTGSMIQASQHNPPLEDIAAALTLRLSRDGSAPMTGALQAAVGSVTLPGVVFQTDASSGLYKTTNGIGVAIGGVKVGEFLPGGISGARFLGELIPYTCTTAPALTVQPFGQTLSRVTYSALWVVAQTEIAAGSVLYNNGDGSTTFGIPDLRGRVPVALDNMGGSPASRTTNGTMTPSGTQLGSVGGIQTTTLITANLPAYTPSGSITNGAINTPLTEYPSVVSGSPTVTALAAAQTPTALNAAGTQGTSTFTGSAQGGSSTACNNMQPSIITNYILFAGA